MYFKDMDKTPHRNNHLLNMKHAFKDHSQTVWVEMLDLTALFCVFWGKGPGPLERGIFVVNDQIREFFKVSKVEILGKLCLYRFTGPLNVYKAEFLFNYVQHL